MNEPNDDPGGSCSRSRLLPTASSITAEPMPFNSTGFIEKTTTILDGSAGGLLTDELPDYDDLEMTQSPPVEQFVDAQDNLPISGRLIAAHSPESGHTNMDTDDDDFNMDGNFEPLTNTILKMEKNDLNFFFTTELNTVDEYRDFFKAHKKYFFCDCGRQLQGDGKAKNTYRLVCKDCTTSMPFTRALDFIKNEIELLFGDSNGMDGVTNTSDIITTNENIENTENNENAGELSDVEMTPATGIKRRLDVGRAEQPTVGYNDEVRLSDFEHGSARSASPVSQNMRNTTAHDSDLLTLLHDMRRELLEQRRINTENAARITALEQANLRIQELEAENAALRQQLAEFPKPGDLPTMTSRTGPPTSNITARPAEPVLSYRSIAALKTPVKPKPKSRIPDRKLTGEELARVNAGLPITPQRAVTALYFSGFKKGKDTMRISDFKKFLSINFEVAMRNILNIDFIGRSLCEIHLYADYADTFKEKLKTYKFVDINPLDAGLLQYATAENKVLEAARRYQHRLARRLEQTPVVAHKRYLRTEIDKAKKVLESPTTAMEITPTASDSSIAAAAPPQY